VKELAMRNSCLIFCIGILLALIAVPPQIAHASVLVQDQPQTQANEKRKITDVGLGEEITPDDVRALEDSLLSNPDSLFVRAKLIHYYFEAGLSSQSHEFEAKRAQHVFWLIEHHPEDSLAGSAEAGLETFGSDQNKDAFQRAKELWMQQIEKHADDLQVLHNAAEFLSFSDSKASLEVLQKAVDIDPDNTETLDLLARTYEQQRSLAKTQEEKTALAAKSLGLREREIERATEPGKSNALVQITDDAFDAGDMAKTEQYANELLKSAQTADGEWNAGNAIHKGNIALGRVALRRGDVAAAKQHLVAAGETQGSPNLDSFGPNMTLAKELLEKGERDAVIAYLQACAKFWKTGGAELQAWIATVKHGGTPDFGPNLLY
jgi:tetratricopeptide (TPR) repeat protein